VHLENIALAEIEEVLLARLDADHDADLGADLNAEVSDGAVRAEVRRSKTPDTTELTHRHGRADAPHRPAGALRHHHCPRQS
jgi:hypothetical protein